MEQGSMSRGPGWSLAIELHIGMKIEIIDMLAKAVLLLSH